MDTMTKEQRHRNMSHIKSKNTSLEILVRKRLFHDGFRYRINVSNLPGKPDIVLPKYHTVIFVNGCFWHMHGCKFFVWPKDNADFWRTKLSANSERDKREYDELRNLGWNVIVIWECQLKHGNAEKTLESLVSSLRNIIWIK